MDLRNTMTFVRKLSK